MTNNSKYILYLNFFKKELKKYLSDENLEVLILEYKKLEKLNLFDRKSTEVKDAAGKDILYYSLKYRRSFEELITYLEFNLSKTKYLQFLISLARFSLTNSEVKLAIDLCYKIVSPGVKRYKKLKYRAEAYIILSDSFLDQAYWSESLSYLKLAQLIYKSKNDDKGLAECQNRLGIIHAQQGNIKLASEHFESAIKMLKLSNDNEQISKLNINLGIIYTILDKKKKAETYLNNSLKIFIEKKDKLNVALLYHNLGMLYLRNGNLDESQKSFNRSLSISSRNNFLMSKCITLVSKSQLALSKNSLDAANRFAMQGLNLAIKINDRLSQAEFYKIYGIIYRLKKEYKLSESNLLISLRINKEVNNQLNYSETAIELGNLFAELNESSKANYYYDLAKIFYKKNNIKRELKLISDALKEG